MTLRNSRFHHLFYYFVMLPVLLSLAVGCAGKQGAMDRTQIPLRAPLLEVSLHRANNGEVCMTEEEFRRLQMNVENSETYIKQLKNLMEATVGGP